MLFNNETDRLLIIFKDNTKKIIDNVSAYGLLSDRKFFYFNLEDIRSFIPADLVNYFGSLEAWVDGQDGQNEKDQSDIVNRIKEYISRLEGINSLLNGRGDSAAGVQSHLLNNIITDLKNEVLGERK